MYVADTPSAAVARKVTLPADTACITPFASMLAMLGVSEVHVNVVGTTALSASCSVAKSWSSNPTGSAGSVCSRPLNVMSLGVGSGPSMLQRPNVAVDADAHVPSGLRCNDCFDVVCEDSETPISTDERPAAGPSAAVNTPSYERNSTTAPDASTSAIPSGAPF